MLITFKQLLSYYRGLVHLASGIQIGLFMSHHGSLRSV